MNYRPTLRLLAHPLLPSLRSLPSAISLGGGGRVRTPGRVRELIRDQSGQGLIEFVMLLTISIALCYVLVKVCIAIVGGLYGKLEGEVSRPSHYR